MATLYQKYDDTQITDNMLEDASHLFSENYGIWSADAGNKTGLPGARVKMSKTRLRAILLPPNVPCSYVRVTIDGELAGHVFACRWKFNSKTVCWITQLVVHRDYRERRLATGLLSELKEDGDDIYGVASSHPATCLATARASGTTVPDVELSFIANHAEAILQCAPISYIRNAKLSGSLFDTEDCLNGAISSVNTGFFVDHGEPLTALARVRETSKWPLGELTEGHEFLLICPVRHHAQSTATGHAPTGDTHE